MSVIRRMTIKRKLISIVMITSITVLILAGTAFIAWEWIALRHTMARNLSTQAEMIADNCKASLAFNDPDDARQTLSALHAEHSIVFGGVYNKKGELFAGCWPHGVDRRLQPAELQRSGYTSGDGFLTVFKTIILDGEIIGTVCVRSDLHPIYVMLIRNIRTISAILLLASLAAYVASSKLQNIISAPILGLAESARTIGKGDLSHRVQIRSKDELGYLARCFNEMAEHLQNTTTSIENLNLEIAHRKKAEQALEELNKDLQSTVEELNRSNRDLQDYAHIIAHDLKTPLRGIAILADWISIDHSDKLNERGKEQVGLLISKAKRMSELIDGLLQYSKIGRVRKQQEKVDLSKLIADVISQIAPPENIQIIVENELPAVTCEKARLTQVFQNLLSNAIKFMDKPQGQVRIGCVEENGLFKFSVADNGPGIAEQYFDKIFKIFQTLSSRDGFESTGVGLTMVKKIVEMYSGRMWVESKIGKGSTFFFTLPKQEMGVEDALLQANISC